MRVRNYRVTVKLRQKTKACQAKWSDLVNFYIN